METSLVFKDNRFLFTSGFLRKCISVYNLTHEKIPETIHYCVFFAKRLFNPCDGFVHQNVPMLLTDSNCGILGKISNQSIFIFQIN